MYVEGLNYYELWMWYYVKCTFLCDCVKKTWKLFYAGNKQHIDVFMKSYIYVFVLFYFLLCAFIGFYVHLSLLQKRGCGCLFAAYRSTGRETPWMFGKSISLFYVGMFSPHWHGFPPGAPVSGWFRENTFPESVNVFPSIQDVSLPKIQEARIGSSIPTTLGQEVWEMDGCIFNMFYLFFHGPWQDFYGSPEDYSAWH